MASTLYLLDTNLPENSPARRKIRQRAGVSGSLPEFSPSQRKIRQPVGIFAASPAKSLPGSAGILAGPGAPGWYDVPEVRSGLQRAPETAGVSPAQRTNKVSLPARRPRSQEALRPAGPKPGTNLRDVAPGGVRSYSPRVPRVHTAICSLS